MRLNLTEWDKVSAAERVKLARKAGEEITRGSMPDPRYLPIHPTAKLTDAEKQKLIAGLLASMSK